MPWKKAHHTIPWSFVWKTIPITHSLSFYFVNLFQLVFFFICLSFSFSRAHSLSVLFDAIFPLVLNQIMPCVIEFLSILWNLGVNMKLCSCEYRFFYFQISFEFIKCVYAFDVRCALMMLMKTSQMVDWICGECWRKCDRFVCASTFFAHFGMTKLKIEATSRYWWTISNRTHPMISNTWALSTLSQQR